MTKTLLTTLMTVAATMSLMAATETVGGYTWTYRINGNTAEIFGDWGREGNMLPSISPLPTGAVTIPMTLGGKPVTRIGDSAFCNCGGMTKVTIPDSVTGIGDSAFSDCSGLTSVTVPASVKSIAQCSFVGCWGLTSLVVPIWCGNAKLNDDYNIVADYGQDLDDDEFRSQVLGCPCVYGGCRGRDSQVKIIYKDVWSGGQGGGNGAGKLDNSFLRAQVVNGALYTGFTLAGSIQVKAGRINASRGTIRFTAVATLLTDGKVKKFTAKAATLALAADGTLSGTLVFKAPINEMLFNMTADGNFTLSNASYAMSESAVGGELYKTAYFTFEEYDGGYANDLREFEDDERYMDVATYERYHKIYDAFYRTPIYMNGRRWTFEKNATVRWANKWGGTEWPIVPTCSCPWWYLNTDGGKTNVHWLRLSYAYKTGIFKGSYNIYSTADNDAEGNVKGKKIKANVIGIVIDGIGYAMVSANGLGSWNVIIK